jgi:hypothetical protein
MSSLLNRPTSLPHEPLREGDLMGNQTFATLASFAISSTIMSQGSETIRFEGDPIDPDSADGAKLSNIIYRAISQRSAAKKPTDLLILTPAFAARAYHQIMANTSISTGSSITKSDIEIASQIITACASEGARAKRLYYIWQDRFSKGDWLGFFHSKIRTEIDVTTIQLGVTEGIDATTTESSYHIIATPTQSTPTFQSPAIIARRGTHLADDARVSFIDRWESGLENPTIPPAAPTEIEETAVSILQARNALIRSSKEISSSICRIRRGEIYVG